jgi:hypothetical protein
MATIEHEVVFETATREEIHAELDALAHDAFGLTADEFAQRLESGELDALNPTVGRLAVLARLIRL